MQVPLTQAEDGPWLLRSTAWILLYSLNAYAVYLVDSPVRPGRGAPKSVHGTAYNTAAGFSLSEWSETERATQLESCSAFYDLVSEVPHRHLYFIPFVRASQVTKPSPY